MRGSLVVVLFAVVALPVLATGFGLKPGLWETRIVKQVVDGQDRSAQMAEAQARMQQMMANVPPERRAQMEAMMKQHGASVGFGSDGSFRICISPEQASLDKPIVDKDGRCQPATVTRSGNRATFEFSCASNGTTTSGKGVAVSTGDTISTQVDTTSQNADGKSHVMHSETEMKFLGSDCGDVKPVKTPGSAR